MTIYATYTMTVQLMAQPLLLDPWTAADYERINIEDKQSAVCVCEDGMCGMKHVQ